ncbi:MAG: Cna B-type domain-containing protein, partial [Clostridia bacterium]|nr:Cna B-type domain-containing protein [Clostridia bacterium]
MKVPKQQTKLSKKIVSALLACVLLLSVCLPTLADSLDAINEMAEENISPLSESDFEVEEVPVVEEPVIYSAEEETTEEIIVPEEVQSEESETEPTDAMGTFEPDSETPECEAEEPDTEVFEEVSSEETLQSEQTAEPMVNEEISDETLPAESSEEYPYDICNLNEMVQTFKVYELSESGTETLVTADDNGVYHIDPDKFYTFEVKFAESRSKQFPNNGDTPMVYTFPGGFYVEREISSTFNISGSVNGESFTVYNNPYHIGNSGITVNWNAGENEDSRRAFQKLCSSGLAEFRIRYSGKFEASEIPYEWEGGIKIEAKPKPTATPTATATATPTAAPVTTPTATPVTTPTAPTTPTPVPKSFTKKLDKSSIAGYDGLDSDGLPRYEFSVVVQGLDGDFEFIDEFDTDIFEFIPLFDNKLRGGTQWYINTWNDKTCTVSDVQGGKKIFLSANDVPKDNGKYCEYYTYKYMLKVKDKAALDKLNAMTDKDGKLTLTNTAVYNNTRYPVNYPYQQPDKKKGEVVAFKYWNDDNNKYGIRPASVQFRLYQVIDGVENLIDTKTLTAGDIYNNNSSMWKADWGELPMYTSDGKYIEYRIREVSVPDGYNVSYNNGDRNYVGIHGQITNTVNRTGVVAYKRWNDNNDKDKIRPTSVQFQLYQVVDGVENLIDTKTLTAGDIYNNESYKWKAEWSNLPRYTSDGKSIEYRIRETSVPDGYEVSYNNGDNNFVYNYGEITNTHLSTNTDKDLVKSQHTRFIGEDGLPYWCFNVLVTGVNGDFVLEDTFDTSLFEVVMTGDNRIGDGKIRGGNKWSQWAESKTTVTMTPIDGGVKFYLAAQDVPMDNGQYYDTYKISYALRAKDAAAVAKLKELSGGNECTFYNTAKAVGLEKKVPFIFTHPDTIKTSVWVKKIWDDNNNSDNLRPSSIQIELYANNQPTGKVVTLDGVRDDWDKIVNDCWEHEWSSEWDNKTYWGAEWKNLPKYGSDDKLISYTFREITSDPNYTTTYPDDKDYTVSGGSITNKHVPYGITKSLNKSGTTSDGRPYYVFNLTINGVHGDVTVTDTFNTDIFEIYEDYANSENLRLHKAGKNSSKATVSAVHDYNAETGMGSVDITIPNNGKIPLNGNEFYSEYTMVYAIVVKDKDALSALDTIAAKNGGTATLTNSVSYHGKTDSENFNHTYEVLEKIVDDSDKDNFNLSYTITFNPGAAQLNNGEPINDLYDVFTNFSIRYSSVQITDENGTNLENAPYNVSYDITGNNISFYNIPDNKKVVIEYTGRILGELRENIPVSNEVHWKNSSKVVANDYIVTSEGDGIFSGYNITLIKTEKGLTSHKLAGATFALYELTDDEKDKLPKGADLAAAASPVIANGSQVTFTTGEDGTAAIYGDYNVDGWQIWPDATYFLKEISAPEGFEPLDYYIQFRITKGTVPDYNNYVYLGGDEIKVTNEKVKANLEIKKTVEGASLTSDKTFNFTVKGTVMDEETEQPVEVYYYIGADGKAVMSTEECSIPVTVKAGETGASVVVKPLPVGEYTVTEIVGNNNENVQLDHYIYDTGSVVTRNVTVSEGTTTTAEIANRYTKEKTSFSVTKNWADNNNEWGKRPDSVQVQLYQGTTALGDAVTLNSENGWSKTWTDLDKYDDAGNEYRYTVEETLENDYYENGDPVYDNNDYPTSATITNTIADTVSVAGAKTWNDAGHENLRPGTITVYLVKDGVRTETSVTVNAQSNWTYSFGDLPRFEKLGNDVREIVYSVEEVNVDSNYTDSYDDQSYDIANSIKTKTSVTVHKNWAGDTAEDRPSEITVHLWNGTTEVDSATIRVDAEGNWKHTFDNLEKFDDNGNEIVYTVTEDSVDGYIGSVDGLTITNTLTNITVSKVEIGKSAEIPGAHLQILENGNVVKDWTSGETAKEIKGLKTGVEYTLKETVAPEGYTITSDIKFTIDENGNVKVGETTVTDNHILVEDSKTSVKISKVEVGKSAELPGAELKIVDKDGKEVTKWTSGDKPHEVTGLKTGVEYTLKETVAPEGYTITSDIKFTIDENGNVKVGETTVTDNHIL